MLMLYPNNNSINYNKSDIYIQSNIFIRNNGKTCITAYHYGFIWHYKINIDSKVCSTKDNEISNNIY